MERQTNLFASEAKKSRFVKFALTGLGSHPSYYKYMVDTNRRGQVPWAACPDFLR